MRLMIMLFGARAELTIVKFARILVLAFVWVRVTFFLLIHLSLAYIQPSCYSFCYGRKNRQTDTILFSKICWHYNLVMHAVIKLLPYLLSHLSIIE